MINIIQIHTQNKPDVSKNGIIINPISCVITPKLNGENELEMECYIDDEGLYKYVENNNYIAVPTPDFTETQLYKIYNTKKSMSGYSKIAYARHVQFNLAKNVIFNKSLNICNGQQALDSILEHTEFIGHSDITIQDTKQYKLRNVQNVINGSEEDSFINVWGGEISCNNYNITINTKRGSDKGIRVTFGYNLEDIEEDLNFDDVITRLYPYSGDLVLSGNTQYVDSPLISSIGIFEDTIEFSDIKVKENADDTEGFDTRAQAEAEMVSRCNKLYNKGLDKITANYVVKMQDLSKTNEYKALGYDALEKICLGDTVHCYNKNIDIEVEARCISYKWDCINEEYIEIELGQFISNYVNMQNDKLDNLYRTIQQTEQNILLQVTSLDNALNTKIEMTAGEIRQEATNTKEGLESLVSQTAGQIRNEVEDVQNDLGSYKIQTAQEISERVTNTEFGTYKTQTATDISQKVAKGTEFSTEMKQNISAFQFLFEGASDGKTEIDSTGVTVYEGGFRIKDSSGNTIMYISSGGIMRIETAGIDNLVLYGTEKGGSFYNSIANMEELYCDKYSCERLYIGGKHIYNYVYDMIEDYCRDMGWID